MLRIKRIFTSPTIILLYSLLILSFNAFSAKKPLSTIEQLISRVEFLFREPPEKLNYNEVIELSNKIILHRKKYPNEVLAKTYLLLANVASNKGELETAYQFTQDGLNITLGQEKVRLCLQIKLASILSEKKQYNQLLTVAQQAIDTPKNKDNIKYYLFALSYRSVALAVLNQYENALIDLQMIESIIKSEPTFSEHIPLLSILANAHFYLGNYQTALTMQLKVLKLRFSLNRLDNVDQTYFALANIYYRLNQFNDAYNAYWEAKQYAQKKSAQIYVAYAHQGLGLTLIKQKLYSEAQIEILAAKQLFYQHNLARPYLETLISLVLVSNLTEHKQNTAKLLLEAEQITKNIELTDDYIVLYQFLAHYYQDKGDMNKAFLWQNKYSQALLQKHKYESASHLVPTSKNNDNTIEVSASEKTRKLSLKLAEQSELANSFSMKYRQQQLFIFILSTTVLLLVVLVALLWFKHKTAQLKKAHEAVEKPNNTVAPPVQTKQLYETNFNMAKKHTYPLTLGYISISNWQELSFQFNKKIVAEVNSEIASIINKHVTEFESAGLINEGEYLLIFPHQQKDDVAIVIEKLVSALKLRFFANLGDFSVIIAYSIESPNFQDIDPYIFLSQLSDAKKIA